MGRRRSDTMTHIVDNPPDADFFDTPEPGREVCINYPNCENEVSGNNTMCGECLDKARKRERRLHIKWDKNVDDVRAEFKNLIEYREAVYEGRAAV